ncbi:MAG TPA: hypothetical protein ENK78_06925 [Thiothrix sp.]|nr:hypothetical protein [Thiothrix sp.]
MPTELTLQIEGKQAQKIAAMLQQHLASQHLDITVTQKPMVSPSSDSKASLGDVLGVAAFVMTIPGFYLTMDSLLERLSSKSKLEKLAKQTDELIGNRQATVWIIVDGKPYQVTTRNVSRIHEALAKQAELQEKQD